MAEPSGCVPKCAGCDCFNRGPEHRVCSSCFLKTKAEEWGLRKSHDVPITLPPFEAGMLLACLTKELALTSVIDVPDDPIRKTALRNCYEILTQQLSDWQRGRGDAV